MFRSNRVCGTRHIGHAQPRSCRAYSSNAVSVGSPGDSSVPRKQTVIDTGSVRRLVELARPEWSLIAMSLGTLSITSTVTMLLPYSAGQVIDYTIQNGQNGISPMIWASGLLGLTAISAGGVYLRTVWLGQAGNRLVARLKQRLFASLLRQEVAFFANSATSTGDLLSRLSADTSLVQATLTSQVVAGLRSTIMTLGSMGMLIYTCPTLALVSCGTLPPVFILTRHYGKALQREQKTVQKEQGAATAVAQQALNHISTVQQFVAESYERNRYHTAIAQAHSTAVRTVRAQAVLESAAFVAANGAVLSVLGYGGTLVLDGSISAGDLSGFVLYSLLMAGNVATMSSLYAELVRAMAAAERIFEILDREPLIPAPSNDQSEQIDPLQRAEAIPSYVDNEHQIDLGGTNQRPLHVEFCNVVFRYPSRPEVPVLDGFSMEIAPGESVALVGGSGAGKSTIAALLTKLYDAPGVRIDGVPISQYEAHKVRAMVGVVPQQPSLVGGTIRENILYGSWHKFSSEQEQSLALEAAAKMAHVSDFANDFPDGLDTNVGANGLELSGGQRQRIAIARVLLKDAPLVILDEATASLDARSERKVHQAMESMMQGRTVLSIAHRLSTIRVADRIVVLRGGKVVQTGTYDYLASSAGPFSDLMKSQMQS